ncbi:MAG TPA: SDR family oxidoreductase [Acidimicrobiales bacterium]|nr:SDR family oxidoreductase [Acidimicrobiales bacterium]
MAATEPFAYRGATALVTGASSGLGAAFAEHLAALGADLLLVARSAGVLEEMAARLCERYGVAARPMPTDLADPASRAELAAQLLPLRVDLLVNNAGVGSHGSFAELPVAREVGQVELNCVAVVQLSRLVLPGMLERGRGGIVNMASTAAFQPTPTMSTYGATKAFVLAFSTALAEECRGSGVRVLAFCPGPVQTGFAGATGGSAFASASFAKAPRPEQVVPLALLALDRGRVIAVPGLANRLGTVGTRLAPRTFLARVSNLVINRPSTS